MLATGRVRAVVIVLAVMTAALGVSAALFVTPGLPYDEPAHWANVLFFIEHARLPVLGEAGVRYEGQQTPLYYVAASLVAAAAGEAGFLAVRLLGVAGQVVLTLLTAVILARVARGDAYIVVGGTAFIALNPMLAVISASVQNDTWALVWGLVAVAIALQPPHGRRWVRGALVGLAASLAILTKLSMAPLLVGLVIAYVLRRRLVEPTVASAAAFVLTGWWFVRNLVLYGDFTGQSAVALTGAEFHNAATTPAALAQTVLTYLTLPTEYVRNTIEAPSWIDALAIAVGVLFVAGLVVLVLRGRHWCDRWGLLVVSLVAGVSFVAWLAQVLFGWPVAFRTAYATLPLLALAAGVLIRAPRRRGAKVALLAVLCAAQLVTAAWFAYSVVALSPPSMLT